MITRYEIKFRITHEQKDRFMEAARRGLVEDPHGENACYRVTSTYFDSRDLNFYWEKVNGVAVRRKLRLRFYGEIDGPQDLHDRACFLELKRRINDSVSKERVRLTREGTHRILEDARNLRSVRGCIADEDLQQRDTIVCLENLEAAMNFEAANVITYLREAWVGSVDNRLRVTFDQTAHVLNPDCYGNAGSRLGLPVIPPGHYVMEIKFNQVFPRWIRDVVFDQGLLPRRFSKYAAGIETLRNNEVRCQSNLWAVDAGIGTDPVAQPEPEPASAINVPQVEFELPTYAQEPV